MRTIWLALVPVVLGVGSTAHGQEARAKKAKPRSGTIWAVSHQEANAPQPLAPPVSLAAPVMTHPAPPHAAPVETVPCPPGKCGNAGKLKEKCGGLLDWLCYRRSRSCVKEYCGCYFCHPPLYLYFLGQCREGACYTAQCDGPKCCQVGCWGKLFSAGHAMFAMPTGHGACGIR